MADQGSRQRAQANAPSFLDALGGLADTVTGGLRGAAKVALGWPGDMEHLGAYVLPAAAKAWWNGDAVGDAVDLQKYQHTLFPRSEDVGRWLPDATNLSGQFGKASPFEELAGFAPVTPGQVGALAKYGAGKVGRVAAEAIQRGVTEGRGPLSALQATLDPMNVVRQRGGNFNDGPLKDYLQDFHLWVPEHDYGQAAFRDPGAPDPGARVKAINNWLNTNYGNYIKKDLGSAADPLLQVEKDLPGLHLPEGDLNTPEDVAQSYTHNLRQAHRQLQSNFPKALDEAEQKALLHHQLTGGAPQTPWGERADRILSPWTLEEYKSDLLSKRFNADEMQYASYLGDHAQKSGFRFTDADGKPIDSNAIMNFAYRHAKGEGNILEGYAEHSPEHKQLLDLFNEAHDAALPPWLAKAPEDTKIWGLSPQVTRYGEDPFGTQHIVDYLDAATDAHGTAQLNPEIFGQMGQLGQAGQRDYDRARRLHDAGLTLDPERLGRLSVADAVRKTAAWNELMATKAGEETYPDLARGIAREHKTYPDGMRWVELGKGEPLTELPEGYKLNSTPMNARGYAGTDFAGPGEPANVTRYAVETPTGQLHPSSTSELHLDPDAALKAFFKSHPQDELAAGLNAEGDAMGHCAGRYCNDVASRGTKIYSLRDANNAPHVTIEVTPGKHPTIDKWSARNALDELVQSGQLPEDTWQKYYEVGQNQAVSGIPDQLRRAGLLDTVKAHLGHDKPPRADIQQIKGKQNAAPVDKYKPYVQDFVKNGQWGQVMDLDNTGLTKSNGTKGPLLWNGQHHPVDIAPGYYTDDDLRGLLKGQGLPDEAIEPHLSTVRGTRYAQGGSVEAAGNALDSSKVRSPRFAQCFAVGGVVRNVLERVGEALPELGRAGVASAKAARASASRGGASFEELAAPMNEAVRTKGGNFYPYDVGRYLGSEELKVPYTNYDPPSGTWANMADTGVDDMGAGGNPTRYGPVSDWAKTQLANYLRKDLGSATDPLLALEKELPDLHLPPGTLTDEMGPAQEAQRVNRMKGAKLGLGPSTQTRRYANIANQHFAVSDQDLTPWGFHSTQVMQPHTVGTLLGIDENINLRGGIGDLHNELDYASLDPSMNVEPLPHGTSQANLAKIVEDPENEAYKQFGWMSKAPTDTRVWGMGSGNGDPLGFSHVLDYLDAATGAHKDIQSLNVLPTDNIDRLRRGPRGDNGQLMVAPGIQRLLDMHDAGLVIDPASLGRVSVADAVRKTAAWNELLAKGMSGPKDPDLLRGIKQTHKEYDDGHKWVELGEPSLSHTLDALPEGWTMRDLGTDHSHVKAGIVSRYAIEHPSANGFGGKTPEEALANLNEGLAREHLDAGLNAEGDAMGHCVGRYCDDVANNGTKIYSLRDKQGNPHVTIETRPNKTYEQAIESDDTEYWDMHHKLETELRKRPTQVPGGAPPSDYPDVGRHDAQRTAFHDWLDATEKYSDVGKTMQWLKRTHPDLHEEFNVAKPGEDIIQIKGKQDAAPVAKYLPMVQDFVKNGTWGKVGDLENTGLHDIGNWRERIQIQQLPAFDELFGPLGRHPTTEELEAVTGGKLGMKPQYNFDHISEALRRYQETQKKASGGSVTQPVVQSRFGALMTRLQQGARE
jgi:hypothetical protein